MELIRAVGGDDVDLRSRALAILGAVSVLDHREFAHRIHAQQLSAAPPGVLLISEALVNSIPFSRKRFSCGRRPETANIFPTTEFEVPIPPARWEV